MIALLNSITNLKQNYSCKLNFFPRNLKFVTNVFYFVTEISPLFAFKSATSSFCDFKPCYTFGIKPIALCLT